MTNYNSVTEHMLSVIHEHLELGHRLSSNRIVDRMGTKAQLDIDKEGVLMLLSSDEERYGSMCLQSCEVSVIMN